jgi:hypothetical protein
MRRAGLPRLGSDEGDALGAASAEGGGCGVGKRQIPFSMPSSGECGTSLFQALWEQPAEAMARNATAAKAFTLDTTGKPLRFFPRLVTGSGQDGTASER